MLLNDAVKAVKRYSHRGDQSITSDQITIDIVAALEDARGEVISRIPKRWLLKPAAVAITTSDGDYTYSLASDVQEPVVFRYTDSNTDYVLKKIDSDKEWFGQIYSSTEPRSNPIYYREIGNDASGYRQIELFPIPDGAYTINYEYYKIPADMTVADLSTEIPDIPSHLQDAVWKGGLYYFYKMFDDPAQAIALQDFQKALQGVDEADEADQDSNLRFRWDIGRYRDPQKFYLD